MRSMFFRRRPQRDRLEIEELMPELSHGVESEDKKEQELKLDQQSALWASAALAGVEEDDLALNAHHAERSAASASQASARASCAGSTAAEAELSDELLRQLDQAAAAVFSTDTDQSSAPAALAAAAPTPEANHQETTTAPAAVAVPEAIVTEPKLERAKPAPESVAIAAKIEVDAPQEPELHEQEQDEERTAPEGPKVKQSTKSSAGRDDEFEFELRVFDTSDLNTPTPISIGPLLEGAARERYERIEAMQAQRASAQEQAMFRLSDESEQYFDALVHSTEFIKVRKPTLLDDEHGEVETEDFVTGNVTILATGTDSAQAIASGTAAGAESADDEAEGDESNIEKLEYLPGREHFRSSVSSGDDASLRPREPKLIPMLMQDIAHTWLVYFLALVACALCLAKIYQVQETRELTSALNDITFSNADLDKEWLNLMAERQSLSEHAKIRTYASEHLQMQAPKIESEQVISITGSGPITITNNK